MDFFSILKSYNKKNVSTYADLLGETTQEERLKRDLTDKELEDYMIIKESNKQRLYIISGNNKPTDYRTDQPKQKIISGIGQVQQMM